AREPGPLASPAAAPPRPRPMTASPRRSPALLALAASLAAAPLEGQLRPVEPAPWALHEAAETLAASAGVGLHRGQRAALAGTEGRLLELGNFQLAWRSGPIVLEALGTAYRVFEDGRSFAAPSAEVSPGSGPRRT